MANATRTAVQQRGQRTLLSTLSAVGDARLHHLRVASFVFVGYYLGARLGLALTFVPNPVSVLWPPNSVVFAALLLLPVQSWWVVAAAALPAHLLAEMQGGVPIAMVLCWFVSNMSEALIGATCLRLLRPQPVTFGALRDVSAFMVAAFVAAFLSSFIDAAFVAVNAFGDSSYWVVWRTRLLSNVTAALTVVPVIVTWHASRRSELVNMGRAGAFEAGVLIAGLLAVTLVVFNSNLTASVAPALIYLPLPFLLWATLRFGPRGASGAFALVAMLVIWGTGHGLGPLGTRLPAENAFSVQLFLIFVGPTLLCLAAALEERRRAEQSRRASDRLFHLLLQATNDAVYERDLTTDAVRFSGHGLAPFGYAPALLPQTFGMFTELIHPDDRERVLTAHLGAVEGRGGHWDSEFRLRRGDARYTHVHEQGLVVRDKAGRAPSQMIGTLTDITERRETEELNQRLAQASRFAAMGELTASIAHEINQPMSAILSNVDAAEMLLDAGQQDSAELRQILEDIRSDDLRASEVIRHIRGLANKREVAFVRFDMNELARAVLRLVAPTARRRGVMVTSRFAQVPSVYGDRIHVQQVLLNLLFNGMDAVADMIPERRRLEIATVQAEAGDVEVRIRDWGDGIPPGQCERIFDSFYTTKEHGMGLGLSITRTLVEANGGRICAENHPDAGAVFRFTLRIDRRPAGTNARR
jgi:two-component system, LuxR family, sensor kinase FixL